MIPIPNRPNGNPEYSKKQKPRTDAEKIEAWERFKLLNEAPALIATGVKRGWLRFLGVHASVNIAQKVHTVPLSTVANRECSGYPVKP